MSFEPVEQSDEIICLGLDLETTGLLESKPGLTELAMVRWSTKYGLLEATSSLILPLRPIPDEVVKLNGITDEAVKEHGILEIEALDMFRAWSAKSDFIMAANGPNFDKPVLDGLFHHYDLAGSIPDRPWADFQTDIPFTGKGKSQLHIAADHGILNPFPHRALSDVLMMFAIIQKGGYDMGEIFKLSLKPFITLVANVSYDDRQLAKDAKFTWDADNREWTKRVREGTAIDFPFAVTKRS